MNKLKIFVIVLTAALAIALVAALVKQKNDEDAYRLQTEKLETIVAPLHKQIDDLENERLSLERSYEQEINGVGTVGLLYTGADSAVYEIAYPEMTEYGYTGVIALSVDSFPDGEGCMQTVQLKEMLDAGWRWCVSVPEDSSHPEADVDSVLARASEADLGSTPIICFPGESYSAECDTWLSKRGFDIVIYHGERQITLDDAETDAGVWRSQSISWRSVRRRDYLSAAIGNYDSIVYEVNLRAERLEADSAFHSSLLSVLDRYCEEEQIKLLTPDEAKKYRLAVEAGRDDATLSWQSKKDAINAQISEIQAQINEISRTFGETTDAR